MIRRDEPSPKANHSLANRLPSQRDRFVRPEETHRSGVGCVRRDRGLRRSCSRRPKFDETPRTQRGDNQSQDFTAHGRQADGEYIDPYRGCRSR